MVVLNTMEVASFMHANAQGSNFYHYCNESIPSRIIWKVKVFIMYISNRTHFTAIAWKFVCRYGEIRIHTKTIAL